MPAEPETPAEPQTPAEPEKPEQQTGIPNGGWPDPEAALYARMQWNVPLSPSHAELLLDRLSLAPGQRITDLGCGWGQLLLDAVARAGAGVEGTGVDTDEPPQRVLTRARQQAARRQLNARFVQADATAWREPADRVLCLGASHAWGGCVSALRALSGSVPAGGRLLFGDGFWARPPSPEAVEMFGEEARPLPALLEAVREAGWRVIHLSTASQLEWDDFESTFRAGRQEWLLANPGHPRAAEIRDWIDTREREYLTVYREVIGFAYLVLAH